jgi:hypothetical protein
MWFSSWLRVFGSNRSARRPAHPAPRATRFRPQLEALEDRCLPSHMPVPVPSTLTVTNNADSGAGSLRAEIAAANPGDTIDLSAISGQTINLSSGELLLNKNLTIQVAAGYQPVTILGYGPVGFPSSRVFEIDGAETTVALNNLNISGGNGYGGFVAPNGDGGAIYNAGKLTLNDCNLSNNSASAGGNDGGAIYNAGSLTLNNCILDDNTAGLDGNDLVGNSAGNGGAIYNAGSLTLNNCILDDNTAVDDGGNTVAAGGYGVGIFNASNATASVTDTSLSGNDGIYAIYNDGTMTLSGSTVTGNFMNGIFNDSVYDRFQPRKERQSIGHLTIQSQSSVVDNDGGYDLYNLGSVSISTDSTVG